MINKERRWKTFLVIPAIHGTISILLLTTTLILEAYDPNSPIAFVLMLALSVAILPGLKTVQLIYVSDPIDPTYLVYLSFLGGTVITDLYLGFLIYWILRFFRRPENRDR